MADYEFDVFYRPGRLATQPDTLSRRADVFPDGGSLFEGGEEKTVAGGPGAVLI